MYKFANHSQLSLFQMSLPFPELDCENQWVLLAGIIDWEAIEKAYASGFRDNGAPAIPARIAVGSLIVKQLLGCSDEWTVKHVKENPYIQYFLGLNEYKYDCPFGASTMVDFRKRIGNMPTISAIIEASIPKDNEGQGPPSQENHGGGGQDSASPDGKPDEGQGSPSQESHGGGGQGSAKPHEGQGPPTGPSTGGEAQEDSGNPPGKPNKGTLMLDATCATSDIAYPQDINILNEAREKTEKIIDEVCEASKQEKPRTYRRVARKEYMALSKKKKRTKAELEECIGKQLSYIGRNIGSIEKLQNSGAGLTKKQEALLDVLRKVHIQQKQMLGEGTHSVPDRIVSISQPFVRPIIRGKAKAKTEFGPKVHVSVEDGYSRLERFSFDAFNESTGLIGAVEGYKSRNGHYPERVLADMVFRNRANIDYCTGRGIRLSGPRLGRPPKDEEVVEGRKREDYEDMCDRNEIEGKFGTGKTAYGLERVAARLEVTTMAAAGMSLVVMNLRKALGVLLSAPVPETA